MNKRTKQQTSKLYVMRQLLEQVREGYLGNTREHDALNQIRDAMAVLQDPHGITSPDPEDESSLTEAFVEKAGSRKMVVVLIDEEVSGEDLLNALARFTKRLHHDMYNEHLQTTSPGDTDFYF
jgi:hypothetical protein